MDGRQKMTRASSVTSLGDFRQNLPVFFEKNKQFNVTCWANFKIDSL